MIRLSIKRSIPIIVKEILHTKKNKSTSLLSDEANETFYKYTKEGTLLAEKIECYPMFCFYTTYQYLSNDEVYEKQLTLLPYMMIKIFLIRKQNITSMIPKEL